MNVASNNRRLICYLKKPFAKYQKQSTRQCGDIGVDGMCDGGDDGLDGAVVDWCQREASSYIASKVRDDERRESSSSRGYGPQQL